MRSELHLLLKQATGQVECYRAVGYDHTRTSCFEKLVIVVSLFLSISPLLRQAAVVDFARDLNFQLYFIWRERGLIEYTILVKFQDEGSILHMLSLRRDT